MMNNKITMDMITGISREHLVLFKDKIYIHKEVKEPLLKLIENAKLKGVDLSVASGYRSFERQQIIWNEKMKGKRIVYDQNGNSIDMATLSLEDKISAILKWSAPPGLSRHHYGTDLDIYDKARTDSDNYKLQLIPEEYEKGGIFEKLSRFLDRELKNTNSGFFRPYSEDSDSMLAEPWHISYKPIADQFIEKFNFEILVKTIENSDIEEKMALINHLTNHSDLV